jgi:beta-fructofuranosidase
MVTRREFMTSTMALAAGSALLGAAGPDPALVKAMDGVRANIGLAASDPERPVYHFHPPSNWTNDPNGTIYYKGWHHLFYQLNPFGSRIGNQHWGHARSKDLVNWEHLPIAIWPSTDKGERAIFSGGAILAEDGRPRLIYTSIGQQRSPEQWMMIPKDDELISWDKYDKPVLTSAAHGSVNVGQWRDPFMFREGGKAYMVCGGNVPGGRGGAGQVQLYVATKGDLSEWKHLGAVFSALERDIYNMECPNLFKVDGKWVLIVSPQRPCEYWVGDLDLDRVRFTPYSHSVLDAGDAYASNISVDDKGRTILWLWGRTNTADGKGWGSVITMPRILSIGSDGFLRQQPAPEFATLRGPVKEFSGLNLADGPALLQGIPGDQCEIEAEFAGNGSFGFELRRSPQGKPGMVVSAERGYLTVGSARTYLGAANQCKLRLFLDKRSVEVYVNDGTVAVYNWVDAAPEDQGLAVFMKPNAFGGRGGGGGPAPQGQSGAAGRGGAGSPAPQLQAAAGRGGAGGPAAQGQGGPGGGRGGAAAQLVSLKAWPLKPATFSLEHFKV